MRMFRVVSSAVVGNTLEHYDVFIYGFFVATIAQHFFPKEDKLTGITSTFAIFFIGYLARPLGAMVFGRIGDRLGRRPAY
jgi:MHS family proline/betaine transporter-like MFS transporter